MSSIWKFTGRARVFESQDAASKRSWPGRSSLAGDVVVIRYEGPKGGPGMQECSIRPLPPESMGLGRSVPCSPTADSPVAPPACPSVMPRPEAADGQAPSAWSKGRYHRDRHPEPPHPSRLLPMVNWLNVVLPWRPKAMLPGNQSDRERVISAALQAYALMATSADKGRGARRQADSAQNDWPVWLGFLVAANPHRGHAEPGP